MISKALVAMYINSLTLEQGIELAHRYGYEFTLEEAKVILPFLKQHRYELTLENKDSLIELARPLVAPETLRKVETIIEDLTS